MNIGSTWKKWDLHIHTPCSINNNYGGDKKENWDLFIEKLENLPKEVKVIGINDYYFIDGFETVMRYKENGRLKNIEKIFPLLEFRIDTFATATQSKFQKINLHILFNIDESHLKEEIKRI
ncbi:MAG: TrlF family AAA-like ATPase, partial [Bacillota bacterium]